MILCYQVAGVHHILWTRECVTLYTTNTTGEIQTWCPMLLCILLVTSSLRPTGMCKMDRHFIVLHDNSQASFKRKAVESKNKLVVVDRSNFTSPMNNEMLSCYACATMLQSCHSTWFPQLHFSGAGNVTYLSMRLRLIS